MTRAAPRRWCSRERHSPNPSSEECRGSIEGRAPHTWRWPFLKEKSRPAWTDATRWLHLPSSCCRVLSWRSLSNETAWPGKLHLNTLTKPVYRLALRFCHSFSNSARVQNDFCVPTFVVESAA